MSPSEGHGIPVSGRDAGGRLAELLAGEDEVRLLARAALAEGAGYQVEGDAIPVDRLVSIYGRRQRAAQRSGQPSIGFQRALEELRLFEGAELALGFIDDRRRGGFYFQLFLAPPMRSVVACFGIKPTRAEDLEVR